MKSLNARVELRRQSDLALEHLDEPAVAEADERGDVRHAHAVFTAAQRFDGRSHGGMPRSSALQPSKQRRFDESKALLCRRGLEQLLSQVRAVAAPQIAERRVGVDDLRR